MIIVSARVYGDAVKWLARTTDYAGCLMVRMLLGGLQPGGFVTELPGFGDEIYRFYIFV